MKTSYVKYFVDGFGEQKAGPYTKEDAEYQAKDISGFEGVSGVEITDITNDLVVLASEVLDK